MRYNLFTGAIQSIHSHRGRSILYSFLRLPIFTQVLGDSASVSVLQNFRLSPYLTCLYFIAHPRTIPSLRDESTKAYGGQGGTEQEPFVLDWEAGERITAVTGNSGYDEIVSGMSIDVLNEEK